jgi:hypothetical protein
MTPHMLKCEFGEKTNLSTLCSALIEVADTSVTLLKNGQ